MKTLYSSTFLSVVLGFFILLSENGQPIEVVKEAKPPQFRTIIQREISPETESPSSLTVKVFTHFNCPECKAFGLGTLRVLQEEYSNKEGVTFEVHLVPDKANETDLLATQAVLCATDQNKEAQMLQKLYEAEPLNEEVVNAKATELELKMDQFNTCLASEETMTQINQALSEKNQNKIDVLPSTLVNNVLFLGAHPEENIEREIRRQL